jgi:hypothetical protein
VRSEGSLEGGGDWGEWGVWGECGEGEGGTEGWSRAASWEQT